MKNRIVFIVLLFCCMSASIIYAMCNDRGYAPNNVLITTTQKETEKGIEISHAEITTSRLKIRSTGKNDCAFYLKLFSEPKNMTFYLGGIPKTEEWVTRIVDTWSQRWSQCNPFSAFVIELLNNDITIGHIVVGRGSEQGQASYAIVIDQNYQDKKYGSEAANAIFNFWCPKLIEWQQRVNGGTFRQLHASAVLENVKSVAILEENEFKKEQDSEQLRILSTKQNATEAIFYRNY